MIVQGEEKEEVADKEGEEKKVVEKEGKRADEEGGEEKGEHKNCCRSLSDADEQRFLPPSFSL